MLSPELYYAVVRHHDSAKGAQTCLVLSGCYTHKHTSVGEMTEGKYSRSRVDCSVGCTYVYYHARSEQICVSFCWAELNYKRKQLQCQSPG